MTNKSHFVLFLFLFSSLYSSGFKSCFLRNARVIKNIQGINCIVVKKNTLLCHDPKLLINPNKEQVIKYDPFLRLYKIKKDTKNHLITKFNHSTKFDKNTSIALISKKGYQITQLQSFNSLLASGKVDKNSYNLLLGSKCYGIVGLGSINQKYISSEILENFINKKTNYYADVGIRLKEISGNFVVLYKDIYFRNNPFEVGDKIKKINGKNYTRIDKISNEILFSNIDDVLEFDVIRDNKKIKLKVKASRRYGGGFVVDSFLERFGVMLDKNLIIKKIIKNSKANKYGLKKGDKLLEIDRKKVASIKNIKEVLSLKKEKETLLLFDRAGFEFFWRIP